MRTILDLKRIFDLKRYLRAVMSRLPGRSPPLRSSPLDLRYLQDLVGADARVILEIGANDGSHTVEFLRLFPDARIYAFEPDPRALSKFKSRVGQHPRVKLFETAIGARDGDALFHVSDGLPPNASPAARDQYPDGWDLSGSLRAPKAHKESHPWVTFERQIAVKVRALDSWMREEGIARIDFIWADVQGAEVDLIAGGARALAATRFFYTEYDNDELYAGQVNLAGIVASLPDFDLIARYRTDVLFRNRTIPRCD
jgi:2-O-methyltransferase